MRNRLESIGGYNRPDGGGRNRLESMTQLEISPTLLEITTIYEKVKKGRDNEIYRLSRFGMPPPPEFQLNSGNNAEETETIPLVPSFPSNLAESESQQVRYLDFNKYGSLPSRKYLYFSAATNAIQSDTLEELSSNYTQLLKSEFYWLNITDPNESDLAVLFNSFNVHDFTISDIRETNTEEKIEFYQHYTFMSTRLLREVRMTDEHLNSREDSSGSLTEDEGEDRKKPSNTTIIMSTDSKEALDNGLGKFEKVNNNGIPKNSNNGDHRRKSKPVDMDFNILLFKNFVITMHDKKWSSINDILGFVNLVCKETVLTPDWVLYSIFIELAQDAQYLLGGIEPRLNELRVGSTSNIKEMSRVLHENYEMEFQLYAIQRFLKPKINILRTLKLKCGRRFTKILLKLLNEIRDDFVEMNNDLRNLNHILERSQDTFLALVSVEKSREANEMSLVMKRLSQIALIFLPIQAISGFFGMNVTVPFQHDDANYTTMYFWIIVAFSFLVGGIMYLSRGFLLKKLNWVGKGDESGRGRSSPRSCFRRRTGRRATTTSTSSETSTIAQTTTAPRF